MLIFSEPPYDDITDEPSTISSSEVRSCVFKYGVLDSLLNSSLTLAHNKFYYNSRILVSLKNQQIVPKEQVKSFLLIKQYKIYIRYTGRYYL